MAIKAKQSKVLTASAVISTANKPAIVYAITLCSGTADSSIKIEDGGSGGTEKWRLTQDGTTAAGETCTSVSFPGGLLCATDAYGTLAGTAAVACVLYEELED